VAARYADGYARYLDHVAAARPFWATRQASAAASDATVSA
jgi:xylulokinase/erythritol kinase